MDAEELKRSLARTNNIRAAWLLGNGAGAVAAGPHQMLLFFVYADGEGWAYGGLGTRDGFIPHFGAVLDKALRAFLASPPRNYNMPLIACRFGNNLLDRDGCGHALSENASKLWTMGAPARGDGQLLRLAWEVKRFRAEVKRRDPGNYLHGGSCDITLAALSLALDQVFAAYCCAQGLWSLPIAELEWIADDVRYRDAVAAVTEFFRTEEIASKARAVLAAAALVIEAIPRSPVTADTVLRARAK